DYYVIESVHIGIHRRLLEVSLLRLVKSFKFRPIRLLGFYLEANVDNLARFAIGIFENTVRQSEVCECFSVMLDLMHFLDEMLIHRVAIVFSLHTEWRRLACQFPIMPFREQDFPLQVFAKHAARAYPISLIYGKFSRIAFASSRP